MTVLDLLTQVIARSIGAALIGYAIGGTMGAFIGGGIWLILVF